MSVVSVTVILVSALAAMSIAHSFEGLQVQNPLFHPGMLDFHQRVNDGGETTNFALWTPVFRGGMGRIDPEHGPPTDYAGGFLHVLTFAKRQNRQMRPISSAGQLANSEWFAS